MVLVKSKVKEIAKKKGFRFPDKTIEQVEKKITNWVLEACNRAKANKRKTLIPEDF